MIQNRRQFVWTAGAAAATLAAYQAKDVHWTAEQAEEAGWQPGIEERRNSTCLICPARCGIRGRTFDGRLVRILGNPLHPASRGGVCPRGVGGVQVLYHPQRIAAPLVRVGERGQGQWRSATPEEAVALLAARLGALRTAGRPERLAVLAGYSAGTMDELWRQFLAAFGSPNYVADDYADGSDTVMALMHGIARRPGYDLERARLVVSFGAPLFEGWWSPMQAYVAFGRQAKGELARRRFVQVDTRFSRTAARAHEWVAVQPGTHGVLALGIAYVLIKEQTFDAAFVARHIVGFEDGVDAAGRRVEGYRSLVLRSYRTEEVSAITGVPVERIVALARGFADGPGAVAVCGADVLHAPDGLLHGLAVHSLNVLLGNIGRPGGVVFGVDPPLAPLAPLALDARARAGRARPPIARPAAPFGTGDQPAQFATRVAHETESPVDALLLYYSNPLASAPNPEEWRTALGRIPFVVSFSPFLDETTRLADLVLPDLLGYERWQDAPTPASYPYPVWGLAQPLVAPPPRARHTGEVLLAVAQALGGDVARSLPYADFPALLKARARGLFVARRGMTLGDEFERTHYRQMEERGWWLPQETDFEAFWKDIVERGGWADLLYDGTDPARLANTASGRIELVPEALRRALARRGDGAEPYVAIRSATPAGATPQFPLRLLPYRVSTLSSGTLNLEPWLAEQPALLLDVHWVPWVEVHPTTAAGLGLADGTLVQVVSARGRYRARLKLFAGAAPGHVNAPYGLKHPDGALANPLQLLDGATDPLTGLAAWCSTFVRLERA
ncbi:MAG TPA: molybdopterin-dependent oxidoreductase [Gemmatimonadales bacterium]|nr:molybdopterin-dependent oxidoreductase [Gemmatimonadales bacterium]